MGKGKLEDYELSLDESGGPILSVRTRGGDADIPQGDMSDAAFAALAKEAQDKGTLVEVKHADGSKTDGESFIQSFGKGRPIIGPDGTLVQTGGDNQTNLPAASGAASGAEGGGGQSAETAAAEAAMHARNGGAGRSIHDQFGDALANSLVNASGLSGAFQAVAPAVRYIQDAYKLPPVVDPGIPGPTPGVDPGQPHPLDFGAPPVPDVSAGSNIKARFPGDAGDPVAPNINLSPSGDYGEAAARRAMELGTQGLNIKAEAEGQKAKAEAALYGQAQKEILGYDAARRGVETWMAEDARQASVSFARLNQQIEDASHAKVDTHRFFSSMDAGQRVAAILAGACFGLAGQGMQWLQHVKSLVDQDIDAQKADHENQLRGLQLKESSLKTAYGLSRQAGLDGLAAAEAAQASMFLKMKLDVAEIGANANTQLAKSNALMAEHALQNEYATHQATAQQHRDSMRVHQAQNMLNLYHMQLQDKWKQEELGVKLELRGGKPMPMTDAEIAAMSDKQTGMDSALNLIKDAVKSRGNGSQVGGVLATNPVVPEAWSDRKQYEKTTGPKAAITMGMKLWGRKALDTEAEREMFLNLTMPSVRDSKELFEKKLRSIADESIRNYADYYRNLAVRNPGIMPQLKPPEEYAREFERHLAPALPEGVTEGSSRAR